MSEKDLSPNILVVDDEEAMIDTYKKYFEKKDWCVDVAYNGSEASFKLNKKKYDVIVTDFKMPYLDGTHLVRMIRSDQFNSNTVIVVVSGKLSQYAIMSFFKHKVSKVYIKPFPMEELVSFLEGVLESR